VAEPAEFVALVPRHTDAMLRVAAALVGLADAEDAAQEAAVRAWQAWDSVRDRDSLRPWLLRITVNVCHQWQRGGFGRRVRLVEALPEDSSDLRAAHDAGPGASDHTGALDLRHAVNALGAELRLVVVLRYYAGMNATEVADVLNIPPATVRTRLKRAIDQLRLTLSASGESQIIRRQSGSQI
jgi:RNA polymerase sigma-70 factor (ECF subfamily)